MIFYNILYVIGFLGCILLSNIDRYNTNKTKCTQRNLLESDKSIHFLILGSVSYPLSHVTQGARQRHFVLWFGGSLV